jgi:hypothetical protein
MKVSWLRDKRADEGARARTHTESGAPEADFEKAAEESKH